MLYPSAAFAQVGREEPDSAKPLIEIRFAKEAPEPGFRRLTVRSSGKVVHVSDENVFTDRDFEHVQAKETPQGFVLRAQWKPLSAERAAWIRRGENSMDADFLAVFVAGELVSAPRVVLDPEARPAQVIDIGVHAPPDEAERMVRMVAERWSGMVGEKPHGGV